MIHLERPPVSETITVKFFIIIKKKNGCDQVQKHRVVSSGPHSSVTTTKPANRRRSVCFVGTDSGYPSDRKLELILVGSLNSGAAAIKPPTTLRLFLTYSYSLSLSSLFFIGAYYLCRM